MDRFILGYVGRWYPIISINITNSSVNRIYLMLQGLTPYTYTYYIYIYIHKGFLDMWICYIYILYLSMYIFIYK